MIIPIAKAIKYNLRYLGSPKWDQGLSPPELLDFIHQSKPGRALGLGCGTGTNLITLWKHGWEGTGIDFTIVAICKARKRLKAKGIYSQIYCGSVVNFNYFNKPFNLVLDIGWFYALDKIEKMMYINNLNILLNHGGTFLIYGFLFQDEFKSGISEKDIHDIGRQFKIIKRTNGYDHHCRKSTWMRFLKQ